MKAEIKKALFLLFLILTYSLQAFVRIYQFSFIYFLGFVIAVSFLYIIKNKYISSVTGVAILVAMGLYNINYIYLTVLPFLLISAHKNLLSDTNCVDKKKKSSSSFSFLLVQLSILATVALLIYSFILIANAHDHLGAIKISRAVTILLCLAALFIYSTFKNRNVKHKKSPYKINKQLSDSLRFIYFISIFAFMATVLYSYANNGLIHIAYEAVYLPWFVYLCSLVYNNDPYVGSLANDIEALLSKISNRIG